MAENTGLFEKIGRYPKIVRDKNVAHTAALTVNSLVDKHFSKDERRISKGAKTRYAKRIDTDAVTVLAAEKNEQEYDPVTGLLSYSKFDRTFSRLLSDNVIFDEVGSATVNKDKLKNTQILKLDIGYLGYANDELPDGYPGGTRYKKAVADIIKEETAALAKEYTIQADAYSWSAGDEFGILAYCDKEKALVLAQKIQTRVNQLIIGENAELPASSSIGVANAKEFLDEFIELSKKVKFTPAEVLDKYKTVLESILDYRQKYLKYIQRMDAIRNLYIRFYINGEIDRDKYDMLHRYVAKGSIGIDDEELFGLMTEPSTPNSKAGRLIPGSDFQKKAIIWVKDVLHKRMKAGLERSHEPLKIFIKQKEASQIDNL